MDNIFISIFYQRKYLFENLCISLFFISSFVMHNILNHLNMLDLLHLISYGLGIIQLKFISLLLMAKENIDIDTTTTKFDTFFCYFMVRFTEKVYRK